MVSHDVERATARATHVLHLNGGRQEFFGAKDDYLKTEGSKFAGRKFNV
jgi:ABC-type sulfate/molybdate transport systems ATPase subunit